MTMLGANFRDTFAKNIDSILYAPVDPYRQDLMDVGSGHRIYFEESGRADGVPVVVLHGGPGTGSSPIIRRFFDPAHFRIILSDQRGAGRSEPAGHLEANTTNHLIDDIERLRQHLKIDSWIVCGGSWGVTLALAYGIAHPDRCRGFLLRSVALGRSKEFRWWTESMRLFFPEAWQEFATHVSEEERQDLLAAYHARLLSNDRSVSGPAAVEWHRYEGACTSLLPSSSQKLEDASLDQLINMARIESHYFANDAFMEEDWILKNISRVSHVPAAIVHGRYDVICPPLNAHELARRWVASRLRIVAASGHSYAEPLLAAAFLEEAERAKEWVGGSSLAETIQNSNC